MKSISSAVEDFIELRQAYGFKYEHGIPVLRQFAEFCEKQRYRRITTARVMDWAQTYPDNGAKSTPALRIRLVRDFATYCRTFDQKTEIPPRELVNYSPRRGRPYIYS